MNKEEIIQGVEDYERAFHKFVDAHKTYLSFEDDEGMIDVANESYDKENEEKFLFDVELNTWALKVKHDTKGMSKSVHKLPRLSKTRKGSRSSASSVREKRRIFEEARLKVEALEQKQSLEHRLEKEAEFKKIKLEIAEERE